MPHNILQDLLRAPTCHLLPLYPWQLQLPSHIDLPSASWIVLSLTSVPWHLLSSASDISVLHMLLAFSSQPKGHFLRDVFPDLSFCFLQFFFSWTCFIFIMLFISKLNYDNYLLFFVCLFLHSLLTCLLPERKGLVCLRIRLYCKNSAWLELAFNKIGMNDLSVF